jgi:hypothetical protein
LEEVVVLSLLNTPDFLVEIESGRDPVVLQLSDPQIMYTTDVQSRCNDYIKQTIEAVNPDLILVTGDLIYGKFDTQGEILTQYIALMESFKIPWAPVFGNHDNDGGLKLVDKTAECLSKFKYFTFEVGEKELGRGNYIINIEQDGKVLHSVFMMDTHDRVNYVNTQGDSSYEWSSLNEAQIKWYKENVSLLKSLGSKESTLIIHIPINSYRDAWWAAYNPKYRAEDIPPRDNSDPKYWNKGYEGSFGVRYEGVSSYPQNDGVLDAILEMDHTKNILCGHSHTNTFSIPYKGVRFTFAVKTGRGSYCNPFLNGGTVYRIDSQGNSTVRHEFVDLD